MSMAIIEHTMPRCMHNIPTFMTVHIACCIVYACCVYIYMSCWDFVHAVIMLCLYDILRMHDGIMCMDVGILQLYADIGNVYRHDILCLHDGISTLACCA